MGWSGHQTARRRTLGDRQTETQGNCGGGKFLGMGRGSRERYCGEGRCLYFHQAKEESHAVMMGDTPGYLQGQKTDLWLGQVMGVRVLLLSNFIKKNTQKIK